MRTVSEILISYLKVLDKNWVHKNALKVIFADKETFDKYSEFDEYSELDYFLVDEKKMIIRPPEKRLKSYKEIIIGKA